MNIFLLCLQRQFYLAFLSMNLLAHQFNFLIAFFQSIEFILNILFTDLNYKFFLSLLFDLIPALLLLKPFLFRFYLLLSFLLLQRYFFLLQIIPFLFLAIWFPCY